MKKFFGLALVVMLAVSTALAAEKKDTKSPSKKTLAKTTASPSGESKSFWSFQAAVDLNLRGTDNTDGFPITFLGTGFGFELSAAYNFSPNFAVGLLSGLHAVDVDDPDNYGFDGASWSYAPTEIFARYTFNGDVRPFLTFGMGISTNQMTLDIPGNDFNITIFTESDLVLSPGLGVEFEMGENVDIFTQVRFDILVQSNDLNNAFFDGSLFIPIQLGLNFQGI
jgi:opacity protein-like surface antigen